VLYVFGFERLGVVLSDLYFADPNPEPGNEGAERGVRLEGRYMELAEQGGTVYASRPIIAGEPLWRVDLLETVTNPGSLDRAHHHPTMRGWEPGRRKFEADITEDPMAWLAARLDDLSEVKAALDADGVTVDDAELAELRAAGPEIVDAVQRLRTRIGNGELAREPMGADSTVLVRTGWL